MFLQYFTEVIMSKTYIIGLIYFATFTFHSCYTKHTSASKQIW